MNLKYIDSLGILLVHVLVPYMYFNYNYTNFYNRII